MRAVYGVQINDKSSVEDLMFSLDETMDQLAMANTVCLYCHVLRREDGQVLRKA